MHVAALEEFELRALYATVFPGVEDEGELDAPVAIGELLDPGESEEGFLDELDEAHAAVQRGEFATGEELMRELRAVRRQ